MKKNSQILLHINTGSLLFTTIKATGKLRYYVIVGMSPFEYAMVCLYPKDELNADVQFLRNLKDSFLPLTLEEFPEIEFVADCSRIVVKRFGSVAAWLSKKGNAGSQVPDGYVSAIIDKLLQAVTISSHQKKEFNLLSYQ